MKKITKLLAATSIASMAVLSTGVHAKSVEHELSSICDVVKNNDKSTLRKKMRNVQSNYNLRISDYYDGITCGDKSLVRVAFNSNAEDTGTVIIKKLSKKVLKAPESDGVTIVDWAKSQPNVNAKLLSVLEKRVN